MLDQAEPGLTRDGHLLELTAHELLLDELEAGRRRSAEAHLASCEGCRERLDGLRAELAEPLPPMEAQVVAFPQPPARPEPIRAPPPRRIPWVTGLAGGLALAAGLLLFARWPQPETAQTPEHFTARGGSWFNVFRADASGQVRPVASGDEVRAGDRLGFRVQLPRARQVMVLGLDDAGGAPYMAWPEASVGHSQEVPGTPDPTDLNKAIELDATPGTERIIALQCDAPLSWDRAAAAASAVQAAADTPLPALIPGCEQSEVRLRKAPLP